MHCCSLLLLLLLTPQPAMRCGRALAQHPSALLPLRVLAVAQVWALLLQIALGLQHLHHHRVLHR